MLKKPLLLMKTEDAKKYALYNKHKHGDIIITTKNSYLENMQKTLLLRVAIENS